jgi:hypothetical protein
MSRSPEILSPKRGFTPSPTLVESPRIAIADNGRATGGRSRRLAAESSAQHAQALWEALSTNKRREFLPMAIAQRLSHSPWWRHQKPISIFRVSALRRSPHCIYFPDVQLSRKIRRG